MNINLNKRKVRKNKNIGFKKVRVISGYKSKNIFDYIFDFKHSYLYLFIFFLIIIIVSVFFLIKFIFKNKSDYDYDDNTKPSNESIYYEEKFDSYKDAFNKAKDFIDKNLKGILINNEVKKVSEKPKISAVIPCYNCKNYILRNIRSIQNQDLSNLEIVVVNDFSSDNSQSFLEQLQKEDPRIKIINNQKNMGFLYTSSIGTLSSKGKYIFPIDSDDMVLDKDVFTTLSNIADKGNFDILLYDIIISPILPNVYSTSFKLDLYKKERIPNLVLFQPELGFYPIQPSHHNNDIHIVEALIGGRFIKTKIYQQALNDLGEEKYSRFMNYDGDVILNFIFFQKAKSMKYIQKFGYIYVKRQESLTRRHLDKTKLVIYRIYMLDVFIDKSQNTLRHKKIIVGLVNLILEKSHLKKALNTDEYTNKLFISCLDRILKSEYISEEDKNDVKNRVKSLDFIKYNC